MRRTSDLVGWQHEVRREQKQLSYCCFKVLQLFSVHQFFFFQNDAKHKRKRSRALHTLIVCSREIHSPHQETINLRIRASVSEKIGFEHAVC
jgi:hypothetical protein